MPNESDNETAEFSPLATAPTGLSSGAYPTGYTMPAQAPPAYPKTINVGPIPGTMPEPTRQSYDRRMDVLQQQNFQPVILMPQDLWGPIMSSYDSIYSVASFKYAQFNIDQLISTKGYRIFDEMLTMAPCRNPFEVKRSMILANPGIVVPSKNGQPIASPLDPDYDKANEIAQLCSYAIDNIVDIGDVQQDFTKVLYELLRAVWDGFHVTDIIYKNFESGPYKGRTGFRYFASKPAKEIGWELDLYTASMRNIMPYTPMSGYEPPRPIEKTLIYVYNPNEGLPYGQGDARAAYKHYLMLDNLLKFWVVAMERWGSPVLVIKYPSGNPEAFEAAQQTADNIRQGAPPVFPDNVEHELVKVDANNFEGFKHFADWNVEQIAQNILGSTLTTSEGDRVGSMALGHVHQDTQQSRITTPRTDLENIVYRQLFRRLVRYNFGADCEYLTPTYNLRGMSLPSNCLDIAQTIDYLIRDGSMSAYNPLIRTSLNLPTMTKEEYAWSLQHSVPPDVALAMQNPPPIPAAGGQPRRNGTAPTDPHSADKGASSKS